MPRRESEERRTPLHPLLRQGSGGQEGHEGRREKELHYRLMRKVYKVCRDERWRVTFTIADDRTNESSPYHEDVGGSGYTYLDQYLIVIDVHSDLLSTFLHECLHVILKGKYEDDKEEEAEVRRLEKLMMRNLSRIQAKRVHRHMAHMFSKP